MLLHMFYIRRILHLAHELQKFHTAELIRISCYGIDYVRVILSSEVLRLESSMHTHSDDLDFSVSFL